MDTLKTKGRNKKDIQKDLEIEKYKCEYLSNKYDVMQYFENISKCIANIK